MREIKFRYVWERPKSGAGSYSPSDPKVKFTYNSLDDMESYNMKESKFNEPPPYSWENGHQMGKFSILVARNEYTGLKDSEVKEEYFGDIIEEDDGTRRVIEDGLSAVLFKDVASGDIKYFWELKPHEVIGNIKENKDLLEVKDG